MDAVTLRQTVDAAFIAVADQLKFANEALGVKTDLLVARKRLKAAAAAYLDILNYVLEAEYTHNVKLDRVNYERCSLFVSEITKMIDDVDACIEAAKDKTFDISNLN